MPKEDMKIRVPADLKAWLRQRAEGNSRTMNGEILEILKTLRAEQQVKSA